MRLKAPRFWYKQHHIIGYLFFPLSLIYRLVVFFRKLLYKTGIKKITNFNVPIIVIGNITVGGSGKTPLVIWLALLLKKHGFNPGIVSRGYGSRCSHYPFLVQKESKVTEVGDEALLIAKRTLSPMVIAPDRVAAVKKLLETYKCDVVISDDGLQHYALGRKLEVVVVSEQTQLGNGFCLPAGPLREPKSRLSDVDYVVLSSPNYRNTPLSFSFPLVYRMQINITKLYNLVVPMKSKNIEEFAGKKVHVVAAIGSPERFFNMLRSYNIDVIEHPFPDHYFFQQQDLIFEDDLPVLLTEKDTMKCSDFANDRCWCVAIDVTLPEDLQLTWLQTLCYNRSN